MLRFVSLVSLLAVTFATNSESFPTPNYHETRHTKVFRRWRNHFNKQYDSILEEAHRFTIFTENWRYIDAVNNQGLSYSLGLNEFADLTSREFKRYVHGPSGSCLRRGEKPANRLERTRAKRNQTAPPSVDWTKKKGIITPVKNQGQCGSCWAFATTGAIEAACAIKHGKLVSLSEQQLVDCSGSFGNQGCNGGLMDNAFKYVESEGGLCSEEEYPYTARDGTCKANSCGTKYCKLKGFKDVPHDNEEALVNAIVMEPVAIAIEADQSAFQFYKSGVLSGTCGTRLDHGVLAVGYGSEGGEDYWKVKNSWGASWGEAGYVRVCRNCNKNAGAGECGILEEPSYPIVE